MSSENNSLKQIMAHRLEKLQKIKDLGINPFPYNYSVSHKIESVLANQNTLLDKHISISGRIISFRKMGKAGFSHFSK